MRLKLSDFQKIVNEDAALRGRATLHPVGDPADKVFPPTHSVGDEQAEKRLKANRQFGAKYAWEWRRHEDGEKPCVLLDSVQSQANRMEEALYRLWRSKKLALPVISIGFPDNYPDLNNITSLTAPHRIADALLRDSLLGGIPFRHSPLGRSFITSTLADVSGLFQTCPTALLYGLWDSTGPTGTGIRLARNLTSEIVGVGAIPGQKTASRIDPAAIVREPRDSTIYKADLTQAPLEQWVLEQTLAAKDSKGEPIKYGKGEKAGRTTSINHSNVPPSLDLLTGGVTMERADQTVVVSLAGLRRLAFGGSEQDDEKAHAVLAALALVAVLAATENPGYFLRSRCQLIPKPGQHLTFQSIARTGLAEALPIELPDALRLYEEAIEALPERLKWHPWDETKQGGGSPAGGWSDGLLLAGKPIAILKPTPKLMTLIERSRDLAAAGEGEEDSSGSTSEPG